MKTFFRPNAFIERNRLPSSRWLSPSEQNDLGRIRSQSRRRQWLAGRWALKCLLRTSVPTASISDFSIRSTDEQGRAIRPMVVCRDRVLSLSASISHICNWTIAGVSMEPGSRVGCDVVDNSQPMEHIQRHWFTRTEAQWSSSVGLGGAHFLWALKESFFKALGDDKPFRPLKWDVISLARKWQIPMPTSLGCEELKMDSPTASLQWFNKTSCRVVFLCLRSEPKHTFLDFNN